MELSNVGKYRKKQMLLKLTRKIKLNRNKSGDFRKLNTLCLGKLSVMLRTKKKKAIRVPVGFLLPFFPAP